MNVDRRFMNGPVCQSEARIHEQVVIVTGANTGIGKETVFQLAERGTCLCRGGLLSVGLFSEKNYDREYSFPLEVYFQNILIKYDKVGQCLFFLSCQNKDVYLFLYPRTKVGDT